MLKIEPNNRTLRIEVAQAQTTDAYIANGTYQSRIGATPEIAVERLISAFESINGHKYKRVRITEGEIREIQRY
jgi:hypothetical protein